MANQDEARIRKLETDMGSMIHDKMLFGRALCEIARQLSRIADVCEHGDPATLANIFRDEKE